MSEEILKALTQLFAIISSQDAGLTETERNFVIGFFKQDLDKQTVDEYVALYDQFIDEERKKAETRRLRAEKKLKKKLKELGKEKGEIEGELEGEKVSVEASENDSALNQKLEKVLVKIRNVEEELEKLKDLDVSMGQSVRTLALCRKINQTLDQRQKVIVLFKLLELLASDQSFTPQRMQIIDTVADVFNIPTHEYKLVERFVRENHSSRIDSEDILIFDDERPPEGSKIKFIDSGLLDGEIIFIRIKSVGLYFTKYTGNDSIFLNSQLVSRDTVLLFSPGSVFKTPKGAPLYYSDLVSRYNSDVIRDDITFVVDDVEFRFPNGGIGLRGVSLAERSGGLIGIMGASGAGKTTLLNVMAGLEEPSRGEVRINGFNIHTQKDHIEGVIGYIAQDDLLIEELTVYQNLYYNAKLCFKDMPEEELHTRVMDVLQSLGLDRIADLVVGSVLNKKISGGQRKRLNIALELIREPAVMFVDEPTSGLSSRDSENVIDLLKELSLKGKLIFVVIHQPSSDIYKMFDKMWLMDTGGYPIFYGNPIEAITYFKSASGQVDSDKGQCLTCGNVNPEQLFNIIEAQVVDEYGEFTNKRKVTPVEWNQQYLDNFTVADIKEETEEPPKTLKIPSKLMQTAIFSTRDFLSKFSNTQYMLINLLEAPLLALLLSWVIRYTADGDMEYIFKHNENVPAYILIAIIVALFMGMTVSAEEIIKDRKILRRESFLNLSRTSYLLSKLVILFGLSGIQTLSFVLIGNFVLDIHGMNLMYWFVLFTVSCHANLIGLNISSAFNSAVTVYILIPILLIPQMILSGLIFDFSKLNNSISQPGSTPLLADIMASRWSYEAVTVEQFRSNKYEEQFFDLDMQMSQHNYKVAYWEPKMQELLNEAEAYIYDFNDSVAPLYQDRIKTMVNEVKLSEYFVDDVEAEALDALIGKEVMTPENVQRFRQMLLDASMYHSDIQVMAINGKDSLVMLAQEHLPEEITLEQIENEYGNTHLSDVLKNEGSFKMTAVVNNKIIQLSDPIFNVKKDVSGALDYRTHFFAPKKHLFGMYFNTYWFNLCVIWFMSIILYFTLYFDVLKKLIDLPSYIQMKRAKE